jgi:pimeloyl-ACP methyl ester carboxylesterase
MTGPTSGFIAANGLRIHYLRWGDSGPSVLLNHATGFLGALWQPIAERLATAGFTAYAYDARGHGDSDKPPALPENYDWHRFAEDLRAVLDHFGLRDIPLIGHSMGAGVGLFVAGHDPGRFSRIVAIEPIVVPSVFQPDETRRREMADGARRRRMVFASRKEMIEQYRARPTFRLCTEEALRLYAETGTFARKDGRVELKCPGEIEGQIFANSSSLDIWDILPEVAAPTLVVRGALTEGFLGMVAQQVSERVQNGRLLTIGDAGHLVPMERPDVVAEEILAFLAQG